jgi:hypothetical protein
MESVLFWLGIFIIVDLAVDVALAIAFWVRGKTPRGAGGVSPGRAILATSGCLTVCLLFIYAGLWMLSPLKRRF